MLFQGFLKDFARPLLENTPERGPGSPQRRPSRKAPAFASGETGCISLALNLIKKLQGFRVQQHFNAGRDCWSSEWFQIRGLDPSAKPPTIEEYLDLVYTEDLGFMR